MEPLEPWRLWTQLAVVGAALAVAALRPLPALRVVVGCVAATVAYGAAQDQFTARLCPEYFTVAHNPIPGVTDPTLLGLVWGFLGGWWGGLMLGLGLAAAARAGPAPPAPARTLVRAVAVRDRLSARRRRWRASGAFTTPTCSASRSGSRGRRPWRPSVTAGFSRWRTRTSRPTRLRRWAAW